MAVFKDSFLLTYRAAKRIVIGFVGASVLLFGFAMLLFPGPGLIIFGPLGLAILGLEFEFARRWLHMFRERSARAVERMKVRKDGVPEGEDIDTG